MKRSRKIVILVTFLILIVPLTLVACAEQSAPTASPEPIAVANADVSHSNQEAIQTTAKTRQPTATIPPTYTAEPSNTQTLVPTLTQIPTSTPTLVPTNTPPPTVTPTETPFIITDNLDRTCPDPAPLRPDYTRYYLPSTPWPQPINGGGDHFWLSHPFQGGGRLLYTDWFPYGYDAGDRYLIHNGLDISEPFGTPVLAMADGTVVVAGDDYSRLYGWRCDWYGHLVVIEMDQQWLDQPVYILYGHVLGISVEVGQHVTQGEQVAEVGVGGAATLPHLHFEVRVGTNEFGSTRNPLLWVRPYQTRGLIVGRIVDPEGRPWQGVAINAVGQSENAENYTTWSYLGDPQNLINPDEVQAENFIFGDVRPGRYQIYVLLQGTEYTAEVDVTGGEISTIEIVTEPLKTPTPAPEPVESANETAEPQPEPDS